MKSLRPRTSDAGLFVVLIASNEELLLLINALATTAACDTKELQNLRVDLMQARYGRKNATNTR